MRRSLRLLLLLAILPAVLAGAYAAAWFTLAGRVRMAIENWAEARRAEGMIVGWDRYAIGGFPLWMRVTIEKPVYSRRDAIPGYEARGERLIGTARPWALRRWHVTVPQGARLAVEPGTDRPALTLEIASLALEVEPRADASGEARSGAALSFIADRLALAGDSRVTVAHAEGRTAWPPLAVASHRETSLAAEVALQQVTIPAPLAPLGDTIDRVAARISVKGALPQAPRRDALTAWRQDGGTVELEDLDLDWRTLSVGANGTLALDAALQPEGALTATIRGYGAIVDALAAAGTLRPNEAGVAKIALGLLAKPGSDGISQITAPVTVQNSRVFLGPVLVARLPKLAWE